MFEVVMPPKKGQKFEALSEAACHARIKAGGAATGTVISIFDEGVLIAVVSDDANGLVLHSLSTATEEQTEIIESFN